MRRCALLLLLLLVGCSRPDAASPVGGVAEAPVGSQEPVAEAPVARQEPVAEAPVARQGRLDDPDVDKAPLPDTPLPTLHAYVAPTPRGTDCPSDLLYRPGATDVVLGETDEERALHCACDPLLLRAATFSSIPPYCIDRHPFPGADQPWPEDPQFASGRSSIIEDLRHLLPRWGRRLCTYSENLLAAAGPGNQRYVGSDEFVPGRCETDHEHPTRPAIGSHPGCVSPDGLVDLNVRSEWLLIDPVAASILAAQAYPRIEPGMLMLSTANTPSGANSAAANNYGFHFHVYPWGFFDVGDPPGYGYIDDGVRFCATPGVTVSAERERELDRLSARFVTQEDWVALWSAPASHPLASEAGWTAVAAGRNHSCGIQQGKPVCWGSDHWGESSPPDVELSTISVGWRHSCGLTAQGKAVCWGDDAMGQASPPDETWTSLGTGDFFTCGLTQGGVARCWGNTWRDPWELPPDGAVFSSLAVGERNACGVADGAVTCWGDTRWPQGQPPGERTFERLELGYEEACGVDAAGVAACWGNLDRIPRAIEERSGVASISSGHRARCVLDAQGQADCLDDLGRSELTPPADARFVGLDVGYAHACGVQRDGRVRCFGGDSFGQASPP